MKYIEAPTHYFAENRSLFLGGGITGCPDWQKEFISKFPQDVDVTIFNPRRANFDISKKEESAIQIAWEFHYLRDVDIVLFWFPKETLCPITLFELGSALERCFKQGQELIVGCHPEYARRFDVIKQIELLDVRGEIGSSIDELVDEVLKII